MTSARMGPSEFLRLMDEEPSFPAKEIPPETLDLICVMLTRAAKEHYSNGSRMWVRLIWAAPVYAALDQLGVMMDFPPWVRAMNASMISIAHIPHANPVANPIVESVLSHAMKYCLSRLGWSGTVDMVREEMLHSRADAIRWRRLAEIADIVAGGTPASVAVRVT